MKNVLVLGANGMLGLGVLKALEGFSGSIYATTRGGKTIPGYPDVSFLDFDANQDQIDSVLSVLKPGDFVVNCIGVIKPHIKDDNPDQRGNALRINSLFPDALSRRAEANSLRVIQIATDCVFSGAKGNYSEKDSFDALDVYGKTKSLGEIPRSSMMHLRVSIIGPEQNRSTSLFEWVRNQPKDAEISGFTDHEWNGVTTFHFGKLVRGIVENSLFQPGTFHIVPGSKLSKDKLVKAIATRAGREDIRIVPRPSGNLVDRTLSTKFPDINLKIWESAGYSSPPSVEQMIKEMPLSNFHVTGIV